MKHYIAITKPRITVMILVCTAVGYYFGNANGWIASVFLHVMMGTALMASGTAALNQWYEADTDAKMYRTRRRPIAAGVLNRMHALMFGTLVSIGGFVELWFGANPLAAWLALFTLLSYLFLYTPLKRISPVCTTVGAIPGAMPPLIGYAAAAGHLDWWAFAIFAILLVWQFPHFYAIAWMYRDDYARGGIRMLPVVQPDCSATARRIVVCSALLIPVSLLPQALSMTGMLYSLVAVVSGIAFGYFGVQLQRERTLVRARHVLLASVGYLPIVMGLMVVDRRFS